MIVKIRRWRSALALCLVVASAWSGSAAETISGPARVIDGDTISIDGQRIRLEGIDAPERRQTCGPTACGTAATIELRGLVTGVSVRCEVSGLDRYRRALATCYAGSLEVNREMVRSGHAIAYRRYSHRYVPEEAAAKGAKRGIWAGEFEEPEQFRHAGK